MSVNPIWPAITVAFGLNPVKEVKKNLGAHAMGDKNNFLFGGFLRDFNMRFQAGEVLVSDLEVNA